MKRKKNNLILRKQRAYKVLTKGLVAVFVGGEKIQLGDLRTNKVRPFSRDELEAFGHFRYKWSIYIAIMGRDNMGSRYVKGKQLYFPVECFQGDIAALVSEYHYELAKEFNKKHLANVGWVACPNETDIEPEQAMAIFEDAGAFEHTVTMEDL
jgi:hypothetical protein